MRRGNKPDVIVDDKEFLVGFDLSADYCSEHEWGLKFLDVFGSGNPKKLGIDRRKITKFPKAKFDPDSFYTPRIVEFFEREVKGETTAYLIFDYGRNISHIKNGEGMIRELTIGGHSETGVAAAWDGESFGIATTDHIDELKELFEAFKKKDIVIGLFGGHVFSNAGLKILIASRISDEIKKEWHDADSDEIALEKASKKTGIHKKLEKAGKRFFALSPRWVRDMEDADEHTKHDVLYWLNPHEQDRYNACWCTVEELELWILEKGKIIRGEDDS
jgi:hypothetical protein